jgi:hypothetical protein
MRKLLRRRDELGVSGLLEVTAVLLIMGLVLGVVYSTIFSSQNTVLDTNERMRNLDEARTLIATMSKDIRTAVRTEAGTSPFLVADSENMWFYANIETTSAPKLVHLYIDAQDRLFEEVWTHDPISVAPQYRYDGKAYRVLPDSCDAPRCRVRLVGHFVANTSSEPLFTYYPDTGAALTTPMSGSDASLLSIKSVEIELRVKRDVNRQNVNTTVVQNRVRLPNLEYNAVAG